MSFAAIMAFGPIVLGNLMPAVEFHAPAPARLRVDWDALLYALGCVESGQNDLKKGHAGERGRYQITHAVWLAYGEGPFARADIYYWSRKCAQRALRRYACSYISNPSMGPVEFLALVWHRGHRGSTMFMHKDDADRRETEEYLARVLALYDERTRR